jgi:hypothetical protein
VVLDSEDHHNNSRSETEQAGGSGTAAPTTILGYVFGIVMSEVGNLGGEDGDDSGDCRIVVRRRARRLDGARGLFGKYSKVVCCCIVAEETQDATQASVADRPGHMKAVSSGRRQLVDNRPTTDTAFPSWGARANRNPVDPQWCQAWLLLAPQRPGRAKTFGGDSASGVDPMDGGGSRSKSDLKRAVFAIRRGCVGHPCRAVGGMWMLRYL